MNVKRTFQRVLALIALISAVLLLTCTLQSATEEQARPSPADAKPDNAEGIDFFEQRIRPVLIERCYKCHSASAEAIQGGLRLDDREAMRAGGDSGPAVVPGNIEESLLLQAIEYEGALYDMPPDGKMPKEVIADFRRWIEMGAPDPRQQVVSDLTPASNSSAASREDLWVLGPLHRPGIPQVENQLWLSGPIDNFVAARLEQEGLTPARPADRYTLLRRVTFDLTGLPPTPGEIEAFVTDRSDAAFEKAVDRLLDSPAFGDRWARHWFDLSCYADLADVQGDVVIHSAWRYRDYVINALNSDKPFDQFILEQIAGDLLPFESVEQEREQIIATGYLAIGPWTLQNYVKQQLQADVVDQQIDKIGRTFLGMSVRCARCHDHKFDPIPTRDYYALAGIFQSTLTTRYDGPGVWSQIVTRPLPELPDEQDQVAELDRTIGELKQQRSELETKRHTLLGETSPVKLKEKVVSTTANSLSLESPIAANGTGTEYRVSFVAGPSVWNAPSQATSEDDGILFQVLRSDGSVLAYHLHRPGAWSSQPDAQKLREASFTYTGDGSGDVTVHLIASPSGTDRFGGALDNLSITEAQSSNVLFSEDFNAYQAGSSIGSQANTQLPVHTAGKFPGWTGGGLNHSHAVDVGGNDGEHNFAVQLYSGPPGTSDNPQIQEIDQMLREVADRLRGLEYNRPALTHALAVQDVKSPRNAPIYIRGNFRAPGETVPRGFLTAICGDALPAIPETSSGRKELAEWLTSPQNPTTPRVLVNRIWQHIFGAGLVRSVDYFGIHGDKPSHPELLDYLAVHFRDDLEWSLKSLIREMVLSSTYRMASNYDVKAAALDAENRLLWRMNRRRLTAESIRDGMLAISGTLDCGRGGPSLGLEIPGNVNGIGDKVNPPMYSGKEIPKHVVHRRSIYLPFYRKSPDGPLEILGVFDFPHPSEITGQRAERTVATQALFLMNSPFVKEQSRRTAERLIGSTVSDARDQQARLKELYLLVLNRPSEEFEIRQAIDFMNQYSATRAGLAQMDEIERDAWDEFCHALFISNDFLFKE